MSALQIETDSQNTHMLLGGLLLCVQDSVSFEDSESVSDMNSTSAKEQNLLSSGKFKSQLCLILLGKNKIQIYSHILKRNKKLIFNLPNDAIYNFHLSHIIKSNKIHSFPPS